MKSLISLRMLYEAATVWNSEIQTEPRVNGMIDCIYTLHRASITLRIRMLYEAATVWNSEIQTEPRVNGMIDCIYTLHRASITLRIA